ncbi:MAG: hypothetical protein M0Q26_05920 [Chitinophagaceae bacterium]|nr:hypothetical protein [Chitinophagaceae bacterium]MDP1763420.1 hypothetical protein [Sediminibacterium sp.]
MRDVIKNRLILIESLLIILLICVVSFRTCHRPGATPLMGIISQPDTPTQYTDAAGTVHTEIKVATASDVQKQGLRNDYKQTIDSLSRALKIKESRIKDLVKISLKTSGSFSPFYVITGKKDTSFTIQKIPPDSSDNIIFSSIPSRLLADSNQSIEVHYNDPWLILTGQLNNDSSWNYTINEDLNIVTYNKRIGLFKNELMLDISSKNPKSIVSGLTGIKITPTPKKWSIGLQAGYFFDGQKIRMGVGLGVSKTFVRF